VHAVGKPVVLVLMNGSALAVNWAHANVPAIVEAWYPGQEGGDAVAGLIAGDYSPAGRLPVTFYKSADQLPPFTDYSMANRTYRYFKGEVLYPFGHGLSYSTFKYSNPTISYPRYQTGIPLTISVDVTNTGDRDADEVAQLYLTHLKPAGVPLRSLKGFQRVHLAKGETRTLKFSLTERDVSIVNPQGRHLIPVGDVKVWVGGGQPLAPAGQDNPPGVWLQFGIPMRTLLPN
jgi:beta-glucosidase